MHTNFRWVTIALIVGLVMVNYIDRSAISFAITPMSKEFGISLGEYGIISGAFAVGYMVFALVTGALVDRFGPRRVLLTTMVIWSGVTALTPVAGGFTGLLVVRVLLGVGESSGFPAATRIVSNWLPQTERGRGLALIGGVAVSGTLLVSGPVVTQLIRAITWRGMFWALGALGALWAIAAVGLLRSSPAEYRHGECRHREQERGDQVRPDWRRLLANRYLWVTGAGYFAWGFMFWGFMYWLPGFLAKSYGLDIVQVGAFSVVPWAAGLVGALAGGVLTDRAGARGRGIQSRFTIMSIALLLSGTSLIAVVISPSLTTALISISLGVGFGFVTGGIWWVAAIDCAPDQPGSAAGFADAFFACSGIAAPTVMGFIVQSTGTFTSGFFLMSALAVSGAMLMLVSARSRRTRWAPQPRQPAAGGRR